MDWHVVATPIAPPHVDAAFAGNYRGEDMIVDAVAVLLNVVANPTALRCLKVNKRSVD
jgi:hypothetical protein